jgi:hypothetical protein
MSLWTDDVERDRNVCAGILAKVVVLSANGPTLSAAANYLPSPELAAPRHEIMKKSFNFCRQNS